jgi:hypothetical protein
MGFLDRISSVKELSNYKRGGLVLRTDRKINTYVNFDLNYIGNEF